MDITPAQFGLPYKFERWRHAQFDAVSWITDTPGRFLMLNAPVGAGKTLIYMAAAKLSGLRTVVLTATKGLQDQISGEFDSISTDIRGMANYPCPIAPQLGLSPRTVVADAPCLAGYSCPLIRTECQYFHDYFQAQEADIVTTNYQCWMYDQRKAKDLTQERPVDMLILDECHDAPSLLSDYLATELARKECLALHVSWPLSGYSQSEWKNWAAHWGNDLGERRDRLREELAMGGFRAPVLHEMREIKNLLGKLERVRDMAGDWVIEEQGRTGESMAAVKFDPLWPSHYREQLFRNVPKIVMVSATVRPKTATLLGVPESELEFVEYPSSFPVQNRPVIHVPTVRMNHRTEADDSQMLWMLRKLDLLLAARADRKGIVHAVSYRRARFLYDNSAHQSRMLIHGSSDRAQVIAQFRKAGPGAILVSPSVDTGYDFAMDQAEYQVIVKLPFPDTRGAVMKARTGSDKQYGMYLTAQTLQQMTGRVCRSETDRGETLVLDDNVGWYVWRHKEFLNSWWLDSYRVHKIGLPQPLPKLNGTAALGTVSPYPSTSLKNNT